MDSFQEAVLWSRVKRLERRLAVLRWQHNVVSFLAWVLVIYHLVERWLPK